MFAHKQQTKNTISHQYDGGFVFLKIICSLISVYVIPQVSTRINDDYRTINFIQLKTLKVMEKKPIFSFGAVEKTCTVSVIETSSRAIVNVVRAEGILRDVIEKCKSIGKSKDGKETISYNRYELTDEDLQTIADKVLPILTDLVDGFEK